MSGWTPAQILKILETFGPPLLQEFVDGLLPRFAALDLEALVRLGEAIYAEIDAKSEKEALQAAEKMADATVDEAVAEDMKLAGK